jgi:sporulation protein YlmC with PRC-barrel domain
MTRYGTLGDYRFADVKEAADDIRGSKVYGLNDEKLGEIDDVIFDQDTGGIVYVIVDTGGWLSSKKFVVPPNEVRPSVQHRDDYLVELTKEQIESFPAYDGEALSSEEKWADYEKRYRSNWETGPVMHRVATDPNITPTTKQQIDAGSGTIPSATDEEAEAPITPITTEASMDVSTAGPSLRWTTFEDRLRQRREEVLESSIRNAKRATGPTASEREREERRKAS